ncbi:holo-ACP synthase [Microcoleus sp. FACHB-53]|nr:holo-ACP synthase [Microcoleus sp. FACHB-53]MBD2128013.1 holo-ACP synthase [Microcoleus sp. FACHB-1]
MIVLEHEQITGVKGIGIDITPIPKIARIIDRCDCETLNSLFTANEIDYCQSTSNPHQFYALCFATKEAVGKALGTGLAGIDWNEIEANITHDQLTMHLHGKARIQAKKRGIQDWFVTWWYWDNHIFVHVLAH